MQFFMLSVEFFDNLKRVIIKIAKPTVAIGAQYRLVKFAVGKPSAARVLRRDDNGKAVFLRDAPPKPGRDYVSSAGRATGAIRAVTAEFRVAIHVLKFHRHAVQASGPKRRDRTDSVLQETAQHKSEHARFDHLSPAGYP